jgi:hypothetical protein
MIMIADHYSMATFWHPLKSWKVTLFKHETLEKYAFCRESGNSLIWGYGDSYEEIFNFLINKGYEIRRFLYKGRYGSSDL